MSGSKAGLKAVLIYLLCCLVLLAILPVVHYIIEMPEWYLMNLTILQSAYIGSLGGILYCLRATYLNICVNKRWGEDWLVWYYLRPIASLLTGFVSYVFLKAGLLILDASAQATSNPYGYLAIAFIAGYNVDNFLKRLESIANSAWGINKSRIGKDE